MSGTRLSIIIPVLDEASFIETALATLSPYRVRGVEVIVVDGGSRDGTLAVARPLADCVLSTRRGRATQMNAGAAVAHGEILLFLHAEEFALAVGLDKDHQPCASGALEIALRDLCLLRLVQLAVDDDRLIGE